MTMQPRFFDRVGESTTTTGTGNLTLGGAVALHRRFQDVLSTNDLCYYAIEDAANGDYETGLGKLTASTTLNRIAVIASSNANAAVNLSAGTKRVFLIEAAERIGNHHHTFQGRMTLTSGTPVTTSDVTAATTVYLTPFKGNEIWLFTNSAWKRYELAEISLALGTVVSGKNYDIFVYDNAGTLTLEKLVWTNDTTRATALTTQDGIQVKTGSTDRRYVGTIRTTSTTQTEDSALKRFCWNLYNQMPRQLQRLNAGIDGYSYNTAAFRQVNASALEQVEIVVGLAGYSFISLAIGHLVSNGTSNSGLTGIGVGSTTVNSAVGGRATSFCGMFAKYDAVPALGYQFYAWLENDLSAVAATWFPSYGGIMGNVIG